MTWLWLKWHQFHGIVVLRRAGLPATTGPKFWGHTLACGCGAERTVRRNKTTTKRRSATG